jgi:quercetin dioxygenase-like cupin family protein
MNLQFPYSFKNCAGETIIFHEPVKKAGGDRLVGENFVEPKCGSPTHVHWLQEKGLAVVKGKMGYQIQGQPEQFVTAGETVVFDKGTPHRFWNAGDEMLNCKAWVKPAHSNAYFMQAVYNAQNKSGKSEPELFDGAYLLTRYKSEYDILDIPAPVKKIVFPVVHFIGIVTCQHAR